MLQTKATSLFKARPLFILSGVGALALFALPKGQVASALHAIPVKLEPAERNQWARSPAYLLSEAQSRFNSECQKLRTMASSCTTDEIRESATSFEAIARALDQFQNVWTRAHPQSLECAEKIGAAHAVYGFEVGKKRPKPTNDIIANVTAPISRKFEREVRGVVSAINYDFKELPPSFKSYNFCWRGTTNLVNESVHEVSSGGGGPILLSKIAQDWCVTAANYLRSCEAPLTAREIRAVGRDLTCASVAFDQGLRLSQKAE